MVQFQILLLQVYGFISARQYCLLKSLCVHSFFPLIALVLFFLQIWFPASYGKLFREPAMTKIGYLFVTLFLGVGAHTDFLKNPYFYLGLCNL